MENQNHLEQAIQNQKELIAEVNELSNTIAIKKESIMKLQGIIEYLTSVQELSTETKQESEAVQEVELMDADQQLETSGKGFG